MTTFNTSIAASSDDAQQIDSTVTLTGNTVGLYWTGYHVGLRFTNVTIPAGATVTNAHITLTVPGAGDDTPGELTIAANDVDDAATFTTASNNISGRAKTTASVSWTGTDIGTGAKNSPDIKTVIQEIIDRAGWTSGNNIAILLQGSTSSGFAFYAYDRGSYIPSITIEYTTEGGGPARERVVYLSGGIEVYP